MIPLPARLLVAVTVACAALAGCGGSGSSTGPDGPSPTASAASPNASPSSPTASPSSASSASSVSAGYLALGDSVPFGYREPTTSPAPNYDNAASFVGFPQLVGARLKLAVVNASCAGETTASFLDVTAKSNGCENLPGSRLGYRSLYPLHVSYQGSQLGFATAYLTAHPDTRLVSLMLGANDGFRCESTTKDHCLSEIPSVARRITTNLRRILTALRATGYGGRLVLVDYYSTSYSDPLATGASEAVNTAVNAAATGQDVTIADGYAAFQPRAAAAGGDSCKAGLLTRLSSGGCGVHPSAAGQALLATAVEKAAG